MTFPILDVREAAQMNDELRLAALRSQIEAGPLHIAVRQAEAFAHLSKVESRVHWNSPGPPVGTVDIIAGDHSVTNPEQRGKSPHTDPTQSFVMPTPLY